MNSTDFDLLSMHSKLAFFTAFWSKNQRVKNNKPDMPKIYANKIDLICTDKNEIVNKGIAVISANHEGNR